MRLLLAGLVVFATLLGLVGAFGALGGFEARGSWAGIGFGVVLLLLIAGAWALFNHKPLPLPGRSGEEWLRQLDAAGQLERTTFEVKRAFQVEEYEDEGSSYFLELADGSVLFLNGQHFYDYEPDDEGRPRRFPCERFTLLRHASERYTVDIQCEGRVLEPEALAPPFGKKNRLPSGVPSDGHLFRDRSYDELKTIVLRTAVTA